MGARFGPWRRRRAPRLVRIFRGPFSRKEADMLLHLPIVVMATLSPVAVSDTVPKFDIVKECRFEGDATTDFDRCRQDEAIALKQLMSSWTQFAGSDRSTCVASTTIGGFSSYVD